MEFKHISVLLNESIEALNIKPDGIYIDGTAGGAGHSSEIAKRLTTGRLISLDKDPDAIKTATERLSMYKCATVVNSDFSNFDNVLSNLGIEKVDGILLDLGVSSHQIDTAERGFSFHADAPLDMRMSQEGRSAKEFVNEELKNGDVIELELKKPLEKRSIGFIYPNTQLISYAARMFLKFTLGIL